MNKIVINHWPTTLALVVTTLLIFGTGFASDLAPMKTARLGVAPGVVGAMPTHGPLLSLFPGLPGGAVSPLRIVRDPRWDTVLHLEGRLHGSKVLAGKVTSEAILDLMADHGLLFRVTGADGGGWRVLHMDDDHLGMVHSVLTRTHHGMDVVGSQLVLHFASDGAVVSANGRYHPELSLPTKPDIPVHRAMELARSSAGHPEASLSQDPRLVFAPHELTDLVHLCWEITFGPVSLPGELPGAWRIYVDALNGQIVKTLPLVWGSSAQAAMGRGTHELGHSVDLHIAYHADRNSYSLINMASRAAHSITANSAHSENSGTPITSSTSTFANQKAVSIHDSTTRTIEYYFNTHNRRGWDGRGSTVQSNVHVGRDYPNAYWYLGQLWYGDGDAWYGLPTLTACLDIVAHEFGHGVVEATVNLEYQFQSGSLNEHFADWSAAMIDTTDRWQIGTHCSTPDPIRSMANPGSISNQPGHMNEFEHLPNTEEGNWGGVHINNGIPNRALYLAAQRLDIPRVERIWYRVLDARYLTSRAQFIDLVTATLRAAQDLYPNDNAVVSGLRNSFADVGLGESVPDQSDCPPNSSFRDGFCYCNDGYAPNATGTGCEAVQEACPPYSFPNGGYCYCNDGYTPSPDGLSCVPIGDDSCPPNSHLQGTVCVCDDGFIGNPYHGGCQSSGSEGCPPNSSLQGDQCYCNSGYSPDATGSACVPDDGGCGTETFFGRCTNNTLIFCDDFTNPSSPTVVALDCSEVELVCALLDMDHGYDCLAPDEYFCPPNSSLGADGHCRCNPGFIPNSSGSECIPEGTGSNDGCPPNSTLGTDGRCRCVLGYVPDASGMSCVPGCPPNASLDSDGYCRCDLGFVPDPSGEACILAGSGEEGPSSGTDGARSSKGCSIRPTPLGGGTGNGGFLGLLLFLSAMAVLSLVVSLVPISWKRRHPFR